MADVVIKPAQDCADHQDAPKTDGARGLKSTQQYIDDEKNGGEKIFEIDGEKIKGSLNLFADSRAEQLFEIRSRHKKYKGKAKRLSEHMIISYAAGKPPDGYTKKDFEKDIQIFLDKMGMSDHSVIYAVHKNTDNIHIHILLDRVCPYPNERGQLFIPLDTGACVIKSSKNGVVRRNGPMCMQAAISAICLKNNWDNGNARRDHEGNPTDKQRQGVKKQPPHISQDKIDLILDVEKIFSDAENWSDAIKQLEAQNIIYNVAYDKSGKPKGAKFSRKGVYGKSSELSRPNQFFNIVKEWGSHPDAPPQAPKQIAYDAIHESLKKSTSLKELQRHVKAHGCTLKISGSGFRIFVNNTEESFKPSQLGTTSKKIEKIFENNILARKTLDKRKKHSARQRKIYEKTYLRKRKRYLNQRNKRRAKSKERSFFKIIFGLLFAKKYQPILPQVQERIDQKQWHSFEHIKFNLGLDDSDMKPPFVLLITENGFIRERKFENKDDLCNFIVVYSEQNPEADFKLYKKSLDEIIQELSEMLYNLENDKSYWSDAENDAYDQQNMILAACLPSYQSRQKIKNEQRHEEIYSINPLNP